MARKIFLSLISGLIILFITWVYQNSTFSRAIEDGFFKKVSLLWKFKLVSNPKNTADFIFINTGKDLALVEDTADWGNITVSDRKKIYQLTRLINSAAAKPVFTVLDIQFYYPYSIDPQVDSLLEQELIKNKRVIIPMVKDANGNYKRPLYNVTSASSDYRTYGIGFNKYKILNRQEKSIPVRLDEMVNKSRYKYHWLFSRRNNRLSLSTIWPGYYLNNDGVMNITYDTAFENSGKENMNKDDKKRISTQYYNLGEILLDLEANPENANKFFENKIVFIGNFQDDIHTTPVGKMSGPVILANIYLSLINKQQIITGWFLVTLIMAFSAISYVAWFGRMPKVNINEDLFPTFLSKFIRKYFSYLGCMFLLSLISIFLFSIQLSLFLPSLLFAEIEMRHQTRDSFRKFWAYCRRKYYTMRNIIHKSFQVK